MQESIVFLLRVQCRRKKKFTFAISSPDEFLVCLTCQQYVKFRVPVYSYICHCKLKYHYKYKQVLTHVYVFFAISLV